MAWSSVSRVVLLGLGLLALSTVQANACEVRRSRWIDGATVGKPGYCCVDFK
jgi:hypothetical protein